MMRRLSVLSLSSFVVIVIIIIVISYPHHVEEEDGIFIGKVYGDVLASGKIDGYEDLFNQTVQIHFFAIDEDHLTANISNVSRITVTQRGETLFDNVDLDDHQFSIEIHLEGIVAFPVKEFSMAYELSSFNGTLEYKNYRDDVNISKIHGTGILDMEDDPVRFIIIYDGVLIINSESIPASNCKIYFDESSKSHIEVLGRGDIYPYHIPWVRIDGEIELFDCVELDSKGREIKRHDSISFQGHELIVITVAEPDYIDHQGGYFEPWVLRIYTEPE